MAENVVEGNGRVERFRTFSAEVVEEIKKVTWPDWPQLKNATIVIIIFVVVVSIIIGLMDWVTGTLLRVLFDLLTG